MYTFVTSFNKEGYDTYAKHMLESISEKSADLISLDIF